MGLTAATRAEVTVLVVCAAVLIVAVVAQPGADVVHLFGHALPGMCVFRATFGIPCPGCGMTRSFVFLAHGDPRAAFAMNVLGPALFVLTAAQIPYRALRIWRLNRTSGQVTDGI